LKWVADIFFPWGNKPYHQICLYYEIGLQEGARIPLDGMFMGGEYIEGREFDIEFHWVPIESLSQLEVYPANIADLMKRYHEGVRHFVYREGEQWT